MTALLSLALCAMAFAISWHLTAVVRRYALAREMLDVPNARSSHQVATPRGGGMAIVAAMLTTLVAMGAIGWFPWSEIGGLVLAGAIVAAIGFTDDHGHVARSLRLVAHFSGAACVLLSLGTPPPIIIGGLDITAGAAGYILGALFVVWVLNLTNFMDGIDGIAGTEAATVAFAGAALYFVTGSPGAHWVLPAAFACAAVGFLAWNWPPARIFMGDAGSGFLGLMLAASALQAGRVAPELFWSWVILLGVFVVDATLTLARRLWRGERIYEAHRSHAYQHAAVWCRAHRPVTIAVALINLGWLAPLAVLVTLRRLDGMAATAIAYAPLLVLAWRFRAGLPGGRTDPALAARV